MKIAASVRLLWNQKKLFWMAASVPLVGILSLLLGSNGSLGYLSYDLPFLLRATPSVTNKVGIIYVDTSGSTNVLSDYHGQFDRTAYAGLLDELTRVHARLVFFDFVFDTQGTPKGDAAFLNAIRTNGSVLIGAAVNGDGRGEERLLAPQTAFRSAVGSNGLAHLALGPRDECNFIRRLPLNSVPKELPPDQGKPPAAWLIATRLKQLSPELVPRALPELNEARWINYYGPNMASLVPTARLSEVLNTPELLGPFRDAVILVGPISSIGRIGEMSDQFGNPWSRYTAQPIMGVDLHATILLNLMNGDSLRRIPPVWQTFWVGVHGVFIAMISVFLLRKWAVLAIVSLGMFTALASLGLQWYGNWWWTWLVPVAIQTPLGLVAASRISRPYRYHVFISYRRARPERRGEDNRIISPKRFGGNEAAESLYTHLKQRFGLEVFYDVKELGLREGETGTWDEKALPFAKDAEAFVLLLSEGALDDCFASDGDKPSDPLLREVNHALEGRRLIIPVKWQEFRRPPRIGESSALERAIAFPALDYIPGQAGEIADRIFRMYRNR